MYSGTIRLSVLLDDAGFRIQKYVPFAWQSEGTPLHTTGERYATYCASPVVVQNEGTT